MSSTIYKFILRLILFWILLFFTCRVIFYLCNTSLLLDIPMKLILQSFHKGLRLDFSMIGYLLLLPMLATLIYSFIQKNLLLKIIDVFNYLIIILYVLSAVGEMCLYREWKAKLSMQALEHFSHPSEVFRTTPIGLQILFYTLSIILIWLSIKIYCRKISVKNSHTISSEVFGKRFWKSNLFFVFGVGFCILFIRGGWQQIPIQSSDAFFCNQPIVNDAAVNPLWNIAYNIFDYEKHFKKNPFIEMEMKKAYLIVKSLYQTKKDSTISFLATTHPNIIFIILESWSANEIKSFGGDNYAPFMDSLSRQGIRFSKLYSAGYVSDQGITAILSGYPTVSHMGALRQSSKSVKIPCIIEALKKVGYQSGFVYGGDLNYGNIRSYVYNKKFDVVKEEKDFENDLPRGNMGIQDRQMANEYLKLLDEAKEPFVYSWFTVSTHQPYDYEGEKKILTNIENNYVNAIVYSDNALKEFFREAKRKSWYKNTLFVLVSDHSHSTQKNLSVYDPEFHRIPLVFFGDVIKTEFHGKLIDTVYSQLDIVKTILKQMKPNNTATEYVWSKNMFNPYTKPFAFVCNFGGAGFVSPDGFIGFQHGVKQLIVNSFGNENAKTDSLETNSKAFQQSVFEDYRLK